MINAACPECGKTFPVDNKDIGKFKLCACGERFRLENPSNFFGSMHGGAGGFHDDELSVDQRFQGKKISPRLILTGVAAVVAVIILPICATQWYGTYEAKSAFILGLNAFNSKNFSEAGRHLQHCIDLRPQWSVPHLYAGNAAFRSGNMEGARRHFENCLKRPPQLDVHYAVAHANLAVLDLMAEPRQVDAAYEHAAKAYQSDRKYLPGSILVAQKMTEEGKFKELDTFLQEIYGEIHRAPTEVRGLWYLMSTAVKAHQGDMKETMGLYPQIRSLYPDVQLHNSIDLLLMNSLVSQQHPDLEEDNVKKIYNIVSNINISAMPIDKKESTYRALARLHYIAGHEELAAESLGAAMRHGQATDNDRLQLLRLWKIVYLKSSGDTVLKNIRELTTKLMGSEEFIKMAGVTFFLESLAFFDALNHKDSEEVKARLFAKGLELYPQDAAMLRRHGLQMVEAGDVIDGLSRLRESLRANPKQADLKDFLDSIYREPRIENFRPTAEQAVDTRPLMRVKVLSASPYGLDESQLKFKLDGKDILPTRGADTYFYLPANELEAGQHEFSVVAVDLAGNKAEKSFSLALDNRPPTAVVSRFMPDELELTFKDDYSGIDVDSVSITLKAAPGNESKAFVYIAKDGQFQLDDATRAIKRGDPLPVQNTIGIKWPYILKPGVYLIILKMSDRSGNSTETDLEAKL